MMGGYGMMGGMGWFGMLLWGVFLILMVALVLWVVFSLARPQPRPSEPDAQEILRQRFARGEINREEFDQARTALR
jgi:putative membrane protein